MMGRVMFESLPKLSGISLASFRSMLSGDGRFGCFGLIEEVPGGHRVMVFSEEIKEQLIDAIDVKERLDALTKQMEEG